MTQLNRRSHPRHPVGKRQHKISQHQRHHQRQRFEHPYPMQVDTRARSYQSKTFSMLNSVEHEILNAHKYKNI